jgi:hypothetical protein
VITLDTAAPVVTLGAVARPSAGRVEIPYSSSPDTQEIEATFDYEGLELPVLDDGSSFIVEGIPDDALLFSLTVSAEDDVGNRSTRTQPVAISLYELGARLRIQPALEARLKITSALIGDLVVSSALVVRMTVRKMFKAYVHIRKMLWAKLKIDQGDR